MQVALGESLQEQIHQPLAPNGKMVVKISTYGKESSLRYSSSSCGTNQGAPDALCSRPMKCKEIRVVYLRILEFFAKTKRKTSIRKAETNH